MAKTRQGVDIQNPTNYKVSSKPGKVVAVRSVRDKTVYAVKGSIEYRNLISQRRSSLSSSAPSVFKFIFIFLLFLALFRLLLGRDSVTFTSLLQQLSTAPNIPTGWLSLIQTNFGDSFPWGFQWLGNFIDFFTDLFSVASFVSTAVINVVLFLLWFLRWLFL